MELNFLRWISENLHGNSIVNHIVKYITYLGDAGALWVMLAIIFLFFNKTRRCGVLLGIGLIIMLGFNVILKEVIARPRPFTEEPLFLDFLKSINMHTPSLHSFPSGHTFVSFLSATIIALVLKGKYILLYIPATLIALSRVFLLVHYPTDILGGIVFGVILAFAVVKVFSPVVKRYIKIK